MENNKGLGNQENNQEIKTVDNMNQEVSTEITPVYGIKEVADKFKMTDKKVRKILRNQDIKKAGRTYTFIEGTPEWEKVQRLLSKSDLL